MSDEARLFHTLLRKMLREVMDILTFTDGMSRDAFAEDVRTQKAVAMSFVNLGEYAKAARQKCPENVRSYPEIPFDIMAGLRNAAAHEYDKIDFETLYATVRKDIPTLKEQLQRIIQNQ